MASVSDPATGFISEDDGQQAPTTTAATTQAQAIPTGDDDSIGTPPAGQGDTGAIGAEQPEAPKRFGPLGRIVSYLMGEGAVHPQVLDQAADQIDPQGQMSPGDRNVMVVEDANARGGKEAAWKMLQANRVAFNAKQAFGLAAANGSPQKPPDLNAAIDAANQAESHVLDGSNVNFMLSTGGQITATVKGADGKQQVFDLTPGQFKQYLNIGGEGQWDKLMSPGGIAAALTKISQGSQGGQLQTRTVSTPGFSPTGQQPNARRPAAAQPKPFEMRSAGEETYDEQLQKRAWGLFPGAGSQKERADWLSAQEQKENELQNKVDVAKEVGENRIKAARETGASRVQAADVTGQHRESGWKYASDAKTAAAQIKADQARAAAGDKGSQARIETGRKAIAAKRTTGAALTPDEESFEKQLTAGARAPQAPTPQAPTPQAATPGQPPVQGAKFYKGQWYTRGPNGESVPYQQ